MLSIYRIKNIGLRLDKNIDTLINIESPFIAYIGNDFGLVYQISNSKISYYWHEKNISVSIEEFLKFWSGIVLIAEVSEESSEPNYEFNRKKELLRKGKVILLIISILLTLGILGFQTEIQQEISRVSALLINGLGLLVCNMLLLKQMHFQSNSADAQCWGSVRLRNLSVSGPQG